MTGERGAESSSTSWRSPCVRPCGFSGMVADVAAPQWDAKSKVGQLAGEDILGPWTDGGPDFRYVANREPKHSMPPAPMNPSELRPDQSF